MPDTFRLLSESFQDQPPEAESEGFHDFNALSRIATVQPNGPESDEKRLRKPEIPPLAPADISASTIADHQSAQVQDSQTRSASCVFDRQKRTEPPQSSLSSPRPASSMSQMGTGERREEPGEDRLFSSGGIAARDASQARSTIRPENESSKQRNDKETLRQANANATAWRQLPLSELMTRLRSAAPSKGGVQRRLHGMFRK